MSQHAHPAALDIDVVDAATRSALLAAREAFDTELRGALESAGQAASLFDLARGKQAAPNSLMGMAQMLMKGKDNV